MAEASTDPRVHNLDPDLYGLKGDRDISGSTTCYLFARTLDPANRDLAYIAAIGAVGDEFFVDGCLVSENREVTLEAVEQGKMEIQEASRSANAIFSIPLPARYPVMNSARTWTPWARPVIIRTDRAWG